MADTKSARCPMPKPQWAVVDDGDGKRQRVKVVEIDGQRGFAVHWVGSCTGCCEKEDGHPVGHYPTHPKHGCYIGSGCSECGYKGIRRNSAWVSLLGLEITDTKGASHA